MRAATPLLACLLCTLASTGQAQGRDTTNTVPAELRLGLVSMGTRRVVLEAPDVGAGKGTGALRRLEATLRDPNSSALVLRYLSGDISGDVAAPQTGTFELLDGTVELGTRSGSLDFGYELRTIQLAGTNRRFGLGRAGITAGRFFAGSGVGIAISGAYLHTIVKQKADSAEAWGINAEISVTYVPPYVPVYVRVGYSRDVFTRPAPSRSPGSAGGALRSDNRDRRATPGSI